jgi:hypothetical protein
MIKNVFLFILSLFLVACFDQKALLQRFIPKDDDTFARHFVEMVRKGDYVAAQQTLDSTVRSDETIKGLQTLHEIFAHGEPLAFDTIGCDIVTSQGTRRTNLNYQIHFPDSWVVGNVYLERKSDSIHILSSRFQPIADSLEVLNRFSLRGKQPFQYVVLAACIIIPLFILYTLVVCIRSRVRRKWLWIIFILIGFFQLRVDWTSGRFDLQPLSFALFGASALRASPYAPWVLGCAVPIGAIIFLARRRKLTLPNPAQDAS